MELKQISKRIVIAGTLLIWLIKYLIRPLQPFEGPGAFFLGVAPNFFGSLLVPFGGCWFFSGSNQRLARIFHIHSDYDLRQVCILGFSILVVNEYLQKIPLFGRTFDYNDILFSFVGLLISYFVFRQIRTRQGRVFQPQAH